MAESYEPQSDTVKQKKKKAEDVNYPGMCKNGIFIIAATMGDFK